MPGAIDSDGSKIDSMSNPGLVEEDIADWLEDVGIADIGCVTWSGCYISSAGLQQAAPESHSRPFRNPCSPVDSDCSSSRERSLATADKDVQKLFSKQVARQDSVIDGYCSEIFYGLL